MRIALTGATGRVGWPVARHLAAQGHHVTTLGRRAGDLAFSLDAPPPDLAGHDALVHAAFAHVPGRYRGGEGDDPDRFVALNRDGTLRLFDHARACGVPRIIFLSSRAVLDGYPKGSVLGEGLPPRPDSLYGAVKAEAEAWLSAHAGATLATASLRATGVYGAGAPGQGHKWEELFAAHRAGRVPAPRVGTEVHEDDLAAGIVLLLSAAPQALAPATFNVSDIVLDRHDLLALVNRLTGQVTALPDRADPGSLGILRCDRLSALGWSPRGLPGLEACVAALLQTA